MDKNKSKEIINEFYSDSKRSGRNSTMPLFIGSVITLNGEPEPKGEGAFAHLSWANAEGIDFSLSHTGRAGNGLELEGKTDEERNLALLERVSEAVEAGKTYPIKISDIKTRKRSYDGEETTVSYYFFEEA